MNAEPQYFAKKAYSGSMMTIDPNLFLLIGFLRAFLNPVSSKNIIKSHLDLTSKSGATFIKHLVCMFRNEASRLVIDRFLLLDLFFGVMRILEKLFNNVKSIIFERDKYLSGANWLVIRIIHLYIKKFHNSIIPGFKMTMKFAKPDTPICSK